MKIVDEEKLIELLDSTIFSSRKTFEQISDIFYQQRMYVKNIIVLQTDTLIKH